MIALITGATKGIGKAISHALANKGFDLILNSRTDGDLKSLKQELTDLHPGIEITLLPADLSVEKERTKVLEFLQNKFNLIDLLINNAGIYLPGSLMEEPEDHLNQSMSLNLMAPYHLTRGMFPLLKNSSVGQVINICSIASISPFSNGGAYSISKHAVLGFSRNLRAELMPHGIKVSSILPGSTWSDSWKGADLPRERLMEPEDVAKVVVCALELGPSAVLEEVVIRPMEGDL